MAFLISFLSFFLFVPIHSYSKVSIISRHSLGIKSNSGSISAGNGYYRTAWLLPSNFNPAEHAPFLVGTRPPRWHQNKFLSSGSDRSTGHKQAIHSTDGNLPSPIQTHGILFTSTMLLHIATPKVTETGELGVFLLETEG